MTLPRNDTVYLMSEERIAVLQQQLSDVKETLNTMALDLKDIKNWYVSKEMYSIHLKGIEKDIESLKEERTWLRRTIGWGILIGVWNAVKGLL